MPYLFLRALRLLRVFRILKITRYIGESNKLAKALKTSRPKIVVFLLAVLVISIILGTVMYLVEANASSGFTSIPRSVYWTIVTTDNCRVWRHYSPHNLGTVHRFYCHGSWLWHYRGYQQELFLLNMPLKLKKIATNTTACRNCSFENHTDEAKFCSACGEKI